MKNQILRIGVYNGIILCLLLEYLAIGDFTRSAELGATLVFCFWLFFASGILMRLIFLKFLKQYNLQKPFFVGILELVGWIVVQSYLLLALYFNTAYEIKTHFQIHYVYQAVLLVFGLLILLENTKHKLLNGIALIFIIFPITVGIELLTKTSYGEYLMLLNPLPFVLMIVLFASELKSNPKSNPEIIDD